MKKPKRTKTVQNSVTSLLAEVFILHNLIGLKGTLSCYGYKYVELQMKLTIHVTILYCVKFSRLTNDKLL